jgi:16S rRNA (uracil1498-N3)-methyltransferase
MESLPTAAGPPVFLVPAGELTTPLVTLTGPEGHHAAAVRRLRLGERADVSDGAGTLAQGVVTSVGKDSVTLEIQATYSARPPQPRLVVAQALPKGDRGELAVELMTEVGVDVVIPWSAERSITKWQGDRGQRALGKWRATAREAAKQSRRSWLPEIAALATTSALAERVTTAGAAVVLEADGRVKLHELALPETGEILLVVGPEGGISAAERAALAAAGETAARLGPTVLRTSTAGAAAAAVLLSRTARW